MKAQGETVLGMWSHKVNGEALSPVISLLAVSHRDRRFGWITVHANTLPDHGKAGAGTLKFNALKLAGTSDAKQKVFVLGLTPTAISGIAIIKPQ